MINSELTPTLPFNVNNVLLPEEKVRQILNAYGLEHLPIRDVNLYRKAMIHRSYCTRKNENFVEGNTQCPPECAIPLQEESNERLEFLGDAVLNLAIATYLFERYPDENEGFLTKMRTKLVNGNMLGHLCGLLGFDTYLVISKQIEENIGRKNVKLLEDCFEAFLGSIYLEGGFEAAYTWITELVESHLDFSELIVSHNNAKDTLLKYCQHHFSFLPKFMELSVDNMPASASGKQYTVCVKDKNNTTIGFGKGPNKKQAEQEAAKAALAYYGEMP